MERIDLDAVIREPDQGHTSKGISPNGSGRESGTRLTIWDMKRFQRF